MTYGCWIGCTIEHKQANTNERTHTDPPQSRSRRILPQPLIFYLKLRLQQWCGRTFRRSGMSGWYYTKLDAVKDLFDRSKNNNPPYLYHVCIGQGLCICAECLFGCREAFSFGFGFAWVWRLCLRGAVCTNIQPIKVDVFDTVRISAAWWSRWCTSQSCRMEIAVGRVPPTSAPPHGSNLTHFDIPNGTCGRPKE